MKLKGKNLGERQHDFNTRVNEAISRLVNFAAIRDDPVDTDIDQLFKIDIASRLKDLAFLLQTLLSGDSLHITRALKSVWLFDDEYQLIMNPDYLSKNVFPHMSSKMMKKLLTTASIWIKNEERSEKFYMYCKENGIDNMAVKFLVSTSETFKESVLQNDFGCVSNMDEETLQCLIASSFKLADLYRSKSDNYIILYQLRFLYSVDSNKYLDMLETHYAPVSYHSFPHRFGLRISKDTFKRHKDRILKHPRIYTTILNESSIEKYSNSEDAKLFFKAWLPTESKFFCVSESDWNVTFNIMKELEFVLNIIPLGERYEFLKKVYTEKYSTEIEKNCKFYHCGYYKHMTEAQQEKWALDQLASRKEILGAGQDFKWYKFVSFELSFEEMKKLILITKNDNKRISMLCVLVECAKNQTELVKLLNYFYTRHGNEIEENIFHFLNSVEENHNIFNFGEDCWNAFNKLLHSLDVYNVKSYSRSILLHKMMIVTSFYHILHGMDLPEVLRSFLVEQCDCSSYCCDFKIKQYDENGPEGIYKYVLNMYLEELINFEKEEYDDVIKRKARGIIIKLEDLRSRFNKKDEVPEIVREFKKLDKETFESESETSSETECKKVTHHEFMRMLKKDASLVTDFHLLERSECAYMFRINVLLQKLNLYFHDDTAKQYLEYFKEAYSKEDRAVIFNSVYGILILADHKFKTEFISQHTPQDSKVKHDEIDRNLLYVREAICRFACYSRPPVETDYILPYIMGDYLKYCVDMFNVYLTKYPPVIRDKFVKSLLSRPAVSIQKHGIRLAFEYFKLEELITLLLRALKKYQNVSLRMVIYKYVFSAVIKCEATRKSMFEILKEMTLNLKEEECEEVMNIAMEFADRPRRSRRGRRRAVRGGRVRRQSIRDFPSELKGFYLDALWKAISNFSNSKLIMQAKENIIRNMVDVVGVIPKETVKKIITDHVEDMLVSNKIVPDEEITKYESYDKALWDLTHAFICEYCKDDDILELVKFIIQKCVEKWNDVHFDYKCSNHMYVFQRFCSDFIERLIHNSYYFVDFICILESVSACLSDSVPKHEIFILMFKLKVVILTNRVVKYGCIKYKNCKIDDTEAEDISREYVKELENFVKELINNNSFSTAFITFLGDVIVSNVRRMASCLPGRQYPYEELLIFIASNLADSSNLEIVLLAVTIMPEFDENLKNYNNLLDKLAKIDNTDVKYLMNLKFPDEYRVQRRKI